MVEGFTAAKHWQGLVGTHTPIGVGKIDFGWDMTHTRQMRPEIIVNENLYLLIVTRKSVSPVTPPPTSTAHTQSPRHIDQVNQRILGWPSDIGIGLRSTSERTAQDGPCQRRTQIDRPRAGGQASTRKNDE